MNSKGCRRKLVWPNARHCPGICFEVKEKKNFPCAHHEGIQRGEEV